MPQGHRGSLEDQLGGMRTIEGWQDMLALLLLLFHKTLEQLTGGTAFIRAEEKQRELLTDEVRRRMPQTVSEEELQAHFASLPLRYFQIHPAREILADVTVTHLFMRQQIAEEDKAPGEGRATSAYARSKALADDLARSFAARVPVIVVRPTNCFGPWQHPEKAVPRWVVRALLGEPLPVWGNGLHVRDWMFVDDAIAGIDILIQRGEAGEVYNLAPEGKQRPNMEIARMIARAAGRDETGVYATEYDRPSHDQRYAIDASKIRALGWRPASGLEERLAQTVVWYREHRDWWAPLVPEAERLYADSAERRAR